MVKCNITHYIFFIGLFCTVIVYTGGEDPLTYTSDGFQKPWDTPLINKCCSVDGGGDGNVWADLKNSIKLTKELFEQAKRLRWIQYRQTDNSIGYGEKIYPGLFKAFVDDNWIKDEEGSNQLNALTEIAMYWKENGSISQEPSYQKQQEVDFQIGEGFSVAWALIRYRTLQENLDAINITIEDQELILDDLLIRFGNRKERTLYQKNIDLDKNNAKRYYSVFKGLVDGSDISIDRWSVDYEDQF